MASESYVSHSTKMTEEGGLKQLVFPVDVVACAWCKPKRGVAPLPVVSHGICPRHLRMMRAKAENKAMR
jgi:hypothetical protein